MEQNILNIINKLYKNNQQIQIHLQDNNAEYYACDFIINNKKICFRKGKITPTKLGHFISLWKTNNSINIPYDINDNYDKYIFYVEDKLKSGFFIFSKKELLENKILSDNKNKLKGKLGFRIYAPWYNVANKTAKLTQQMQVKYFNDFSK
jgi:hypothetical protein